VQTPTGLQTSVFNSCISLSAMLLYLFVKWRRKYPPLQPCEPSRCAQIASRDLGLLPLAANRSNQTPTSPTSHLWFQPHVCSNESGNESGGSLFDAAICTDLTNRVPSQAYDLPVVMHPILLVLRPFLQFVEDIKSNSQASSSRSSRRVPQNYAALCRLKIVFVLPPYRPSAISIQA